MDYLHRPLHITEKARRADLVTDADRAAEKLILDRLRLEFPTSTIIGEESGTHSGTSQEVWYVDPLDGTTNFAHGYPVFCVSIGFARDDELIGGVVYAPHSGELYVGQKGGGATHPADYERNGEHFKIMSGKAQAVRRDGSAALDLAGVAAGRFDGFWEFDLSSWDVAAGAVIIREAGGRVSAIDGGAFSVTGRSIHASNGHVHEEMGAILQSPTSSAL